MKYLLMTVAIGSLLSPALGWGSDAEDYPYRDCMGQAKGEPYCPPGWEFKGSMNALGCWWGECVRKAQRPFPEAGCTPHTKNPRCWESPIYPPQGG